MSQLFKAMNNTARTANGALTLATSGTACVDFFFQAGASRGQNISNQFCEALIENEDVAIRTLLWLRDVRGGAGERKLFRDLVVHLAPELQERIINRIPELGRWDDMLVFVDTPLEELAFSKIALALMSGDQLCAKWMPRVKNVSKQLKAARLVEDEKGIERIKDINRAAFKLMKFLELTPKQYRRTLVDLTNVVETAMCARNWEGIDYSKIPSVAAARYQGAFNKHDESGYSAYREALVSGETKINAGAVYPYDIVKSASQGDAIVANEQWKALPDYMDGNDESVLAVVDVSGSMEKSAGGSSVSCMNVAISLGIYIAERSEGAFKNQYITFSEDPRLVTLEPSWTLAEKIEFTLHTNVGYSTDFNRVFDQILTAAKRNNLKQEDLPSKVIALSDMEFNEATCNRGWGVRPDTEETNFEAIDRKFVQAGYKRPQLVFWNLNARPGNSPVSAGEAGTALVSGFSPSLLKSILSGDDFTPEGIMLETVMSDRYNF